MRKFIVVAGVLVLLVCCVSSVALAQEEKETKYSWGRVSAISSLQIVVTEYDYDNDEEVDVTYTVDPNTEFKDVDSLESINVGDSVNIEYVAEGEKNVAKVIAVERTSYEEGLEYFPTEEPSAE